MAKNIITKPINEMLGPTAIRMVLKISGLNFSSVVGSPPIRINPKMIKPTEQPIRIKLIFSKGRKELSFLVSLFSVILM